jgi:uncharacterized protein (DUF697 family)
MSQLVVVEPRHAGMRAAVPVFGLAAILVLAGCGGASQTAWRLGWTYAPLWASVNGLGD